MLKPELLERLRRNAAGRRCGRSRGRSRSRDRATPKAATPEEQKAFKKVADIVAEEAARHPDTPIETFATDERRIGPKPVTRRVWGPVGIRPIARGHHRFEWLYVTPFVSPATGEIFWRISNGISKPLFEARLAPVR